MSAGRAWHRRCTFGKMPNRGREVAMKVRELMSRNVMTVGPEDSCHEAVARMHRSGVRHLPVVDPVGGLIGIVTDRDLPRSRRRREALVLSTVTDVISEGPMIDRTRVLGG